MSYPDTSEDYTAPKVKGCNMGLFIPNCGDCKTMIVHFTWDSDANHYIGDALYADIADAFTKGTPVIFITSTIDNTTTVESVVSLNDIGMNTFNNDYIEGADLYIESV